MKIRSHVSKLINHFQDKLTQGEKKGDTDEVLTEIEACVERNYSISNPETCQL